MKRIYQITSLGGKPLSDEERQHHLAAAVRRQDPLFRSLVQLAEEELDFFRGESTDSDHLKDGTQSHFCGGADSLNGFLLKVAEAAQAGLQAAKDDSGK